ncbi:hypothetical protein [Clostridium grantii]|uniref:Uncharacterized protein n=1 Tax=Clostridium grantii DSM 8605 TaxID=1121316 RepID=A0A1M5WPP3_9CLOT|nr:hypothetical protein [Clostridium grantii]SHH89461.1 hypothetical protein SAMN02745207_03035 [Clostridium grantii DSM 8605]
MKTNYIILFLKGIGKFILALMLIVIMAIVPMAFFAITSNLLSGYEDYVIYSTPSISFGIAIVIIYIWLLILLIRIFSWRIGKKNQTDTKNEKELVNIVNSETEKPKVIEFRYKNQIVFTFILISILGLFYGYRTFNVITEDKIIVHNILNLSGKVYDYSDVSEIYTGISKDKDHNLYYKIELKDGKIINLISASIDSDNDAYELSIEHIDEKLLQIGVRKNIDFTNLSKFEDKDYNEEYAENVKRILGR